MALLLPAHLRDRPFTVAEALDSGVPATALRSTSLRRPVRGVRVPAHLPDDLATRCAAALLILPQGAVVSGPTAARLCGLPLPATLPRRLAGEVHVLVDDPGGVPHRRGVVAGERVSRRAPWQHPRGLPVLHPVHTWTDLAPHLAHRDAVALGDAVRRRWADDADLAAAVAGEAGRRGVVRLREVLADVRYRVDSPRETWLRLLLRDAGLPEPCCGRDVVEATGWVARPDLTWFDVKVAAEYDGDQHRTDPRQWALDLRRREDLEAAGWTVIVVTAADLQRPHLVVSRVRSALVRRGAHL